MNMIQTELAEQISIAVEKIPTEEYPTPEQVTPLLESLCQLLQVILDCYIDILITPPSQIDAKVATDHFNQIITIFNLFDQGFRNQLLLESIIFAHNLILPPLSQKHKKQIDVQALAKSYQKFADFFDNYRRIITRLSTLGGKLSVQESQVLTGVYQALGYSLPLISVNALKFQLNLKVLKTKNDTEGCPLNLGDGRFSLNDLFLKQYNWCVGMVSFISRHHYRKKYRIVATDALRTIMEYNSKPKADIEEFQRQVDSVVEMAQTVDLVKTKYLLAEVESSFSSNSDR